MIELQKGSREVNSKYAIYADTESNINLTEKDRRKMSVENLYRSSTVGVKRDDDVYLYTTRHYFYVLLIQKMWRIRKSFKMKSR